jgi:hypothetical protein
VRTIVIIWRQKSLKRLPEFMFVRQCDDDDRYNWLKTARWVMVLKWYQMTRAACAGVAVGFQCNGSTHVWHASSYVLGIVELEILEILEIWTLFVMNKLSSIVSVVRSILS